MDRTGALAEPVAGMRSSRFEDAGGNADLGEVLPGTHNAPVEQIWFESGLGSCSPTSFEVRVTLRELCIVDPDNLSLPKLTSVQQDIGNDHNPALAWLLSFQEAG